MKSFALDQSWFDGGMAYPIDPPTLAHAAAHGYTLLRRAPRPEPFSLAPEQNDIAGNVCSPEDLYALHHFVFSMTLGSSYNAPGFSTTTFAKPSSNS